MNCVVLLGPTAVGKTAVGVQLALAFGGEIISADSRQVYRGLDIGSGKDITDYTVKGITVPYHLIDVADVSQEYNVFNFQQDFYRLFIDMRRRNVLPVIVGGTGLYIDSVVREYDFLPVPEDPSLRARLAKKTLEELDEMLLALKPDLHNKTDLKQQSRVVRAIEIALYAKSPQANELRLKLGSRPDIQPLMLGMTLSRCQLRDNINRRLRERFDAGMIDEVRRIHGSGISWERLERLGLEYRFVSEFLEGKIQTEEELFLQLNTAIGQFAKRQETWFRSMERKGVKITWLPESTDMQTRVSAACDLIQEYITR